MNEVDNYTHTVMQNIHAPRPVRQRIEADLRLHFEEATREGESARDVIARMGTPLEVAEEFMAQVSLSLLTEAAAAEWLRAAKPDGYEAIDRLRPAAVTDATWFLRQIAAMPGDEFTREALADGIDASFVLRPAASTPSRTRAWIAGMPQAFQRVPLRSGRPDLRVATLQPPERVAKVDPERARR